MRVISFLFTVFFAFSLIAEGKIDLNTATASELSTLKGIGKKKAQQIIEWRKEYGPFKSVDELTKIKGIGKKTLEKNLSRITVGAKGGKVKVPDTKNPKKADEAKKKAVGIKFDLNKVTLKELVSVPGIGKAMAGRIIAKRKELTRFSKLDQLKAVKGVGDKSFIKMKQYFYVLPPKKPVKDVEKL